MTWTAKQLRVLAEHAGCEPEIRPHGPHQGLYCKTHNVWIKWIAKDQVQKVRDLIEHAK
jgi:hypothetical protein